MRILWIIVLLLISVTTAGQPALACSISAQRDPYDILLADIVVVGRVVNYEVVSGLRFRQRHGVGPSFKTAFARFDIVVEEVLYGAAPARLTVTWANSTFGLRREYEPGPYLIALSTAEGRSKWLDNFGLAPMPGMPAVLQADCAAPFILRSSRVKAYRVRQILEAVAELERSATPESAQ